MARGTGGALLSNKVTLLEEARLSRDASAFSAVREGAKIVACAATEHAEHAERGAQRAALRPGFTREHADVTDEHDDANYVGVYCSQQATLRGHTDEKIECGVARRSEQTAAHVPLCVGDTFLQVARHATSTCCGGWWHRRALWALLELRAAC